MDTDKFHATDIKSILHKIIVEIFPNLGGKAYPGAGDIKIFN